MEEWKEYRLIDVLDALIDYRGKTPKKTAFGVPLITAKIIKNGRIETPTEFISLNDYDSWMVRGFPKVGDVVLTTEAPLGEVAQLDDANIALAQRVVTLRGKSGILDNTYLKYYFLSNFGHQRLKARETGTTVTGIKQSELREVIVDVPPYEIQVRISNILKSLDDKIEVNRKINENLEQQAQALFKSWFVDFEPFKDSEFVESELGMIPKGWRVEELADIAEISKVSINPQKQPQTEFYHYSIPSYDDGMKPEKQLGEEIKSNKFVLKNKMTLFSKLNPRIKRVWFVDKLDDNSICSTEFVPYKAKEESKSTLLYSLINSQGFYDFVMSMVNGATGSHQRFHPEDSLKYRIAYNETYSLRYCEIVTPIINKILDDREESRRLAELRDTLLPKLMSGELKVENVTF